MSCQARTIGTNPQLKSIPELCDFKSGLVAPKERWATKLYLHRFIEPPKPGNCRVPYTFEIDFDRPGVPAPEPGSLAAHLEELRTTILGYNPRTTVRVQGELAFKVAPSTPEQLRAVYAGFAKQDPRDDWKYREACEALSCVDNPLAAPYLKQLRGR